MSRPLFAAITADLLARKGEARPWNEPVKPPLAAPPPTWRAQEPLNEPVKPPLAAPPPVWRAPEPHPAHSASDCKRISVRLSHHDYERLGILAIKQNGTRQKLLHEALDRLLSGIPQQYGGDCACLKAAAG